MIESGRIAIETCDGIKSISLRCDAYVFLAGYYLSERYNTEEMVNELIDGGDIYEFCDIDYSPVYMNEISFYDHPYKISKNLDEYMQICKQECVYYGYLFKNNKWSIVCGILIGDLNK